MLPNAANAIIDPSKLRDYLLAPDHAVGRFKSVVFTALGYSADNWDVLEADLLAFAAKEPARAGQASVYGRKFEVSGKLTGPNGRSAAFPTVWILKPGETAPRFVTAFPG